MILLLKTIIVKELIQNFETRLWITLLIVDYAQIQINYKYFQITFDFINTYIHDGIFNKYNVNNELIAYILNPKLQQPFGFAKTNKVDLFCSNVQLC